MTGHVSVLYEESLKALLPAEGKVMVDGTLGGGGHTEGLLRAGYRVVGIDKDAAAIERCRERLAPFGEQISLVKDDFKHIKAVLDRLGIEKIDGALLDLGVSSYQLDEGERGFSYSKEAPLDMRMDRESGLSAYDVVNGYSASELRRIIFTYGEDKFAGRIAAAMVRNRPIETTTELSEIIKAAIPAAKRRTGGHPAKRTFQAIRIEVNGELEGLEQALQDYIDVLAPGGRLAVITFHSLEDRAVKQTFRTAENPCTCPPDYPQCVCGKKPKGRLVNRKPILPGEAELAHNPRSRSAKLRIFEKI